MNLAGISTGPETTETAAAMEESLRRGEHYGLLNGALAHLDRHPDDAQTAVNAMRSYTSVGLIGPAREMLEAGGGVLSRVPEFAVLREQMAGMPSGKVPWEGLRGRFERNASLLYAKHPLLREHEAAFRRIPETLELFQSLDGNLHVSEKRGIAGRRWLPGLDDTQGAAAGARLGHTAEDLSCPPYVVLGDRFGALFDRVFAGTQKMFLTFRPRIYLLEPDARLFGVLLWTIESVERLCDERVTALIGTNCTESLTRVLAEKPDRQVPGYVAALPPVDERLYEEVMEGLRRAQDQRIRDSAVAVGAMQRTYEGLSADHWARRYQAAKGGGLKVVGFTSRFTTVLQYSMRDLKDAFGRCGHEFRLVIEPNDHDLLPAVRKAEVVAEFKPDLIVVIDHLRREYGQMLPADVPYVCWVQDQLPHLVNRQAGESLGSLDYFISPEPEALTRKYGYPARQGLMWTMATNEAVYSAEPLPEEELAPYRCDVSLVSNQSQLPRVFHEQRRRMLGDDPAVGRLADFIFQDLQRHAVERPEMLCGTAATFINRAKQATGIRPATPEAEDAWGRAYVQPLAELIFRQSTLEWVADYCDRTDRRLFLYGNGWEEHPRFGKYARGVVRNGRQLRAVYQASRINIQVTSYGSIHQRLLDGLAAGGFFMIRRCPTDLAHEPIRRLLAAVDRYGVIADVTYQAVDVPEVAEASRELAGLYGENGAGDSLCLPAWRLDYLRGLAAGGYRRVAGAVFEQYPQVAFASREEFGRLAERFLASDGERAALASAMRDVVLECYTYTGLVRGLLEFIRSRLEGAGHHAATFC